jgi:hypothetical protein
MSEARNQESEALTASTTIQRPCTHLLVFISAQIVSWLILPRGLSFRPYLLVVTRFHSSGPKLLPTCWYGLSLIYAQVLDVTLYSSID